MCWFVANILLCFELVRGLGMLTLTGCLMITGVIVYHAMQPTQPLVIRFEDGLLIPVYGWAFWLDFAAGHSPVQIHYITFNIKRLGNTAHKTDRQTDGQPGSKNLVKSQHT